MNTQELRRFATDARTQQKARYMGIDDYWVTAEELIQDGIQKEITACYIAAMSPDVALKILDDREKLIAALKQAWLWCDKPSEWTDIARAAIAQCEVSP